MARTEADLAPVDALRLVTEPQRWQLLTLLGESDRRVGDLVELVGRPQSLVSYHLRELRDAGLVSGRRSSADGRDTYYRLEPERCGALFGAAAVALHPALRLVPGGPPAARRARRRRPRVLFLCTGNSARSQIAEALLMHLSGGRVEARSAGSRPKALHPEAVRVLAERGIDISANTTKDVARFARSRFDRVVTLCDRVKEVCPDLPGAPVFAHWSLPDPAAEPDGPAAFDRAVEDIDTRVRLLLAQLAA